MRKLALAASALTIFSLSACAPAATDGGDGGDGVVNDLAAVCNPLTGGEAASALSVTGEFGVAPTVDFPSPLTTAGIESIEVIKGTGQEFVGNQLVEFEYSIYNGGNGEPIQASEYDGTDSLIDHFAPDETPDYCSALTGTREGSRVAFVMSPEIGHNNEGIADLAVGPDDALVFVFDLKRVYLPFAVGTAKAPQAGLPTVILAANRVPGITIPNESAPTELKIATLIEGSGPVIAEDQQATLHYTGFVWETGEKFDSSWDGNRPAQFQVSKGALIDGFVSALVGQKVGSQVIAVIPPDLGYGDQAQGSIPPNSTLIFVIDILGVDAAK